MRTLLRSRPLKLSMVVLLVSVCGFFYYFLSTQPPCSGYETSASASKGRQAVIDGGTSTKAQLSSPPLPSAPDDLLIELNRGFFGKRRVPFFRMYGDGRVIYVRRDHSYNEQALFVQLSAAESQALLQQVLDLGFERLESYHEHCSPGRPISATPLPFGLGAICSYEYSCVSDGSTTYLSVRLPSSGTLRELSFYANFSTDPETFTAIKELLDDYEHPQATFYQPEKATLFLAMTESEPANEQVLAWPIDPIWLVPPSPELDSWRRLVQGEDLRRLLAALPHNMGSFYFHYNAKLYEANLSPWLPGDDYSDELDPPPPTVASP